MQLTAKLIQLLPIQSGSGKNGEWKKQDIIVETEGQYPKKICVSIWGDKINNTQLQVGKQLKIDFEIKSNEYNNKWYTNVIAVNVEIADSENMTSVLRKIALDQEIENEFFFNDFLEAIPLKKIAQENSVGNVTNNSFLSFQNYKRKEHYAIILQSINSADIFPLIRQYYIDLLIYNTTKSCLRVNNVINNASYAEKILSITGLTHDHIDNYFTGPGKSEFDSLRFERDVPEEKISSLIENCLYHRDSRKTELGYLEEGFFEPWVSLIRNYHIFKIPVQTIIKQYHEDHTSTILFKLIVEWSKSMNKIEIENRGYFKFRSQEILNVILNFGNQNSLVINMGNIVNGLYNSISIQESELQSKGFIKNNKIA